MGLSHAQAAEVAKRFNPSTGQTLWFTDDGTVLNGVEAQRAVIGQKGELYVCRRPATGGPVELARVTAEEQESGEEPAYGVLW